MSATMSQANFMSLNLNKLEKVRKLENGIVQARCPACAEGGNDRAGEHLRIYPDGRFGCCVHPKSGEHRKRIFALAGDILQARCPACAEGGNDRSGEHLRIYPDGRFGCCVHPKDGDHRKRIWALAGRKLHRLSSGTFSLRIKPPPALPAAQSVKTALTGFVARAFP